MYSSKTSLVSESVSLSLRKSGTEYISTGTFKAGSNRIKVGVLSVLFRKQLLNGKYCGSNFLIFAISTATRNMLLYFVIAIVQSLSVSIREVFFGKKLFLNSQFNVHLYSTYALCS